MVGLNNMENHIRQKGSSDNKEPENIINRYRKKNTKGEHGNDKPKHARI